MCYEQSLFRSWKTKKAQKRERETGANARSHPIEPPILPDTTRRTEAEQELEEIA